MPNTAMACPWRHSTGVERRSSVCRGAGNGGLITPSSRIAAREVGNPIDLIHGKAAGRAALAKLAAHKDIDLIAAELVKVEADRTPVLEQARLELFEPRDQARHAQEHAGGAVSRRDCTNPQIVGPSDGRSFRLALRWAALRAGVPVF